MNYQSIRNDLRWLRGEDGVVAASEATAVLARVLQPLLSVEGYELIATDPDSKDLGIDLVARCCGEGLGGRVAVGIEYKHHGRGRPIGVETVRRHVSKARDVPYERLLLIGRFGFTAAARDAARHGEPVAIELLDLAGIESWIRRLEVGQPDNAARIQLLIRSLSHEFATLVAEDPECLEHLEWRDLERVMARVMEGLGFKVTLTPPSKDGGKDIILVCNVTDGEASFIIELKHWRSGKRVGKDDVSNFMQVMVAENRSGGLFLSTSGYGADSFEGLTEITRQRLRFGDRTKVVLLAQTYVKACSGLWTPPTELPEVLFEATM
jgi:hypothetical protein